MSRVSWSGLDGWLRAHPAPAGLAVARTDADGAPFRSSTTSLIVRGAEQLPAPPQPPTSEDSATWVSLVGGAASVVAIACMHPAVFVIVTGATAIGIAAESRWLGRARHRGPCTLTVDGDTLRAEVDRRPVTITLRDIVDLDRVQGPLIALRALCTRRRVPRVIWRGTTDEADWFEALVTAVRDAARAASAG